MLRVAVLLSVLALGWSQRDKKCVILGGNCQSNSQACSGSYQTRKCSGPANRQCCVPDQVKPWGTMCQGQSGNKIRGSDKYGAGYYGASRTGGKHKGCDVVCQDSSVVYAPFSGKLIRRARPYRKSNEINNGVMLSGSGYCVKIFYINPDRTSGNVTKGQRLGYLLKMQNVYPGITSHVHIQMCDPSINPSQYM